MQLKHIIKRGLLFLFMMPVFVSASEKELLSINAFSQSVNAQYTRSDLLQLPQQEIRGQLPWTDKIQTYKGPYLEDVFKHSGIEGRWLTMTALDNYKVSFSFQEIKKYKPILALQADEQLLSIRSKGPIVMVLPIDEYQELDTLVYHDYMIWHLIEITVTDKE